MEGAETERSPPLRRLGDPQPHHSRRGLNGAEFPRSEREQKARGPHAESACGKMGEAQEGLDARSTNQEHTREGTLA
jgi:hypothetical protein